MSYELCRHIKANGKRCKAAALTSEYWCYFHSRTHFRHRNVLSSKPVTTPTPLSIPVLEDRESVQVAISLVAGAIATGHLDDKRATTLIRVLTLAQRNVGNAGDLITSPSIADAVCSFLATDDGAHIAPRRMNDDSQLPAQQRARSANHPSSDPPPGV